MVSLENSIKYKEKLTTILLNLFQKIEEEYFPGAFDENTVNLIPKPKIVWVKKIKDQYPT